MWEAPSPGIGMQLLSGELRAQTPGTFWLALCFIEKLWNSDTNVKKGAMPFFSIVLVNCKLSGIILSLNLHVATLDTENK